MASGPDTKPTLTPAQIQRHFLLRRLHSLTGLVPIGVFLVVHLVTNSSLAWGRFALRGKGEGLTVSEGGVKYFQHEVSWINESVPHLLLIEITLWVSIAFHSILGVVYATSGKSNLQRYPHQDNWRYTLQRISGYVGILFIFYHVATLRWGWTFLIPEGTKWSHSFSASTLAAAMQGSTEGFTIFGVAVSVLYMVGVTALVYHFANGLWTAAITWGITISAKAQKRWGIACAGLGAGLMFAGWSSLIATMTLDYDEAHLIEREMFIEKYGEAEYEAYVEQKGIETADEEPTGTAGDDGGG